MAMRAVDAGRLGSLTGDRYRTVHAARIVDMLLQAAFAFEVEAGGRDGAVAATVAAMQDWIGLGLGYRRGPGGEQWFDPVEVTNFAVWCGHAGLHPFWPDHWVRNSRALVMEAARHRAPRRVGVSFRRRFDLRGFAPGAAVRLRLPLPLACAHGGDVAVDPVVPAALGAAVTLAEGRLEARLTVPPDPAVELGAELGFMARGSAGTGGALTAAERALYLRPAEGLVRVTRRVQALADALAGEGREPWPTLRAFWDFMMDELFCGMVQYGQVDAAAPGDWVLDRRWYDCQLGAALLISLCRARGIPARMVGGHWLYRLWPMVHFWAEAWIDGAGWVPFDLASWPLSLGGRDADWREHFFGRADARMVTQILPLAFPGPMSVHWPPAWHMLVTGAPGGGSMAFEALDGGLIHEDRVVLT